ncbi:MAG: methyl-accepting chemotaxis protein [Lachnospiraceae bacterium]|nr:methyl-accepting chemotaxis protein [Lachnospiraceae bacterium]
MAEGFKGIKKPDLKNIRMPDIKSLKKPDMGKIKLPDIKKLFNGGKSENHVTRLDKMSVFRISVKTLLPIFLLAVVSIYASLSSVMQLKKIQEQSSKVTAESIATLDRLDLAMVDVYKLQCNIYSHISTDAESEMATYRTRSEELFEEINSVMEDFFAVIGAEDDPTFKSTVEKKYKDYHDAFFLTMDMSDKGKKSWALQSIPTAIQGAANQLSEQLTLMKEQTSDNINANIDSQYQSYLRSRGKTIVIFIITLVVIIIAILIIHFGITKPLRHNTRKLRRIVGDIRNGNGDLTERLYIRTTDEIGLLFSYFNVFIETLQDILQKIVDNSNNLGGVVDNVFSSIATANGSANDISESMRKLSDTMNNITGTTGSVNDRINDASGQVDAISGETKALNNYASEMADRALNMEEAAMANKTNTSEMIQSIVEKLETAIEETKSVKQVNDLTEEILEVSSQTNLLALNASIEAARAGAAGRGFSVVAEEIRNLADVTKATAGRIQNVNSQVIAAVEELVRTSRSVVDYLNETIMPDYDNFVAMGEQYRDDAVYVNTTMEGFENRTDTLMSMMEDVARSVNAITDAIRESAEGVSNATENTASLVVDIENVGTEMDNNKRISDHLKAEADRFSVL